MKEQNGVVQGVVRWFNSERGFGFVASEGVDYFIHYKEINSTAGFKTLKEGQRVRFTAGVSPKGKVAKGLQVADDEGPWY